MYLHNCHNGNSHTGKTASLYWNRPPAGWTPIKGNAATFLKREFPWWRSNMEIRNIHIKFSSHAESALWNDTDWKRRPIKCKQCFLLMNEKEWYLQMTIFQIRGQILHLREIQRWNSEFPQVYESYMKQVISGRRVRIILNPSYFTLLKTSSVSNVISPYELRHQCWIYSC